MDPNTINTSNKKILVIHGPNMNLLGLRKIENCERITLDKLNRYLRKKAKGRGVTLIIFQTNDESLAITKLQRQRKKIKGIILFPGPWQQSGHGIKDTLEILGIPYITISIGEKVKLLKGAHNIEGMNTYNAAEHALEKLIEPN